MNIFGILIPKQAITYLNDRDALDVAVHRIMDSSYTAVPVIDDGGRYIGVVSEGDFLKAYMEYGADTLYDHTVSELVRPDVEGRCLNTVEKEEVLEKILDRNFLPIVDDRGIFIGIITRKNVIMRLKQAE